MLQSKVSVKYSEENSVSGEVSYYHVFNFLRLAGERGWGGVGAYSRLGANSRLGAYSNKYGKLIRCKCTHHHL